MAVTLEQFGRVLSTSRLLTVDEIKTFWAALGADVRPKTSTEFAERLVIAGKLTRFQADQLLTGRAQRLVLNDYTLVDRIGQGGMGQVFKAHHRRLDKFVALKVLADHVVQDRDAVQRFLREVRATGKLVHPNIVVAHDAGEVEGLHYLVMEHIEGCDLYDLVRRRGPLPVEQAVSCTMQVAQGLQYAHSRGLVHRDIKPSNLLMSKEGAVKILDLGLARNDDPLASGDENLTGTGNIVGTIDYMSPEQAFDSRHVDLRSDVYSLGCTLFYLLNARRPFDGDTVLKRLLAHRERPAPPLGDVPEKLDAVFQRMLAKLPHDRYSNMGDVILALEDAVPAAVDSLGRTGLYVAPQWIDDDAADAQAPSATIHAAQVPGSRPDDTDESRSLRVTLDGLDRRAAAVVKKSELPPARGSRKRLATIVAAGALLSCLGVWAIFHNTSTEGTPAIGDAAGSMTSVAAGSPSSDDLKSASSTPQNNRFLKGEAIVAALDAPVGKSWTDVTLGDLARDLRETYRINTAIDIEALTGEGKGSETSMTWTAPRSSLKLALETPLKSLNLTTTIYRDVLWITTIGSAEQAYTDIQAFIVEPDVAPERRREFTEMIMSVQHETWSHNGGTSGTIVMGKGILLTSHRSEVNREIERRFKSVLRPVGAPVDVSPFSPAVRRSLSTVVSLDVAGEPLEKVLKMIESQCNVVIVIDYGELAADGKGSDTPCTLTLEAVPFIDMLDALLNQLSLGWKLDDETFVIMRKGNVTGSRFPQQYDCTDLNRFFEGAEPDKTFGDRTVKGRRLSIAAIEELVSPIEWSSNGGLGRLNELPDGKAIVVDQPLPVHLKLQRFFGLLRRAALELDGKAP